MKNFPKITRDSNMRDWVMLYNLYHGIRKKYTSHMLLKNGTCNILEARQYAGLRMTNDYGIIVRPNLQSDTLKTCFYVVNKSKFILLKMSRSGDIQ